jgi:TonB family protein
MLAAALGSPRSSALLASLLAVAATGCVPSTGRLMVDVRDAHGAAIPGARVEIDEKPVCQRAPCVVDLPPGVVFIQVTAPGLGLAPSVHQAVIAGQTQQVVVRVPDLVAPPPASPSAPPSPGGTGVVTLATPGARVRLFRLPPSPAEKDITTLLAGGSEELRLTVLRGDRWLLLATKEGLVPFSQELAFAKEGDEHRVRIELGTTPPGALGPLEPGEAITPPQPLAPVRVEYPRAAREKQSEGRVLAKCTVTVEGALVACRIVRSASPELDRAVLDALTNVPMTPAVYRGKAVSIYYTFPYTFRLH